MKSETISYKIIDVQIVLKKVIDPEIGLNIVDLGLVYSIVFDEESKKIKIEMTFTTSGCPMGDVILDHVREIMEQHFPEFETEVNLVWEPAWNYSFITEEGQKYLNN
jgi:metal-sulfur cluster biosynthetic enzyme